MTSMLLGCVDSITRNCSAGSIDVKPVTDTQIVAIEKVL